MSRPAVGDVHTFERTFTAADVRQFAELSRDTQPQHVEADEDGRLMVHGLLTATLPTKIGGDLEVLATRMDLQFRKAVYTGERIRCRWEFVDVAERDDRTDIEVTVVCRRDDEIVLEGTIEGLVWQ